VAVPELVTPYTATGSAPVVGIRTGVLAATGKPLDAVTPEPPMNAAAELARRLGSGGPLPSIDVADALLDERRGLTEWAIKATARSVNRSTISSSRSASGSRRRASTWVFEFCSGLVDLVVGVRHHRGGGHRLTLAGERFVGRLAEHVAQVGDGGAELGDRRADITLRGRQDPAFSRWSGRASTAMDHRRLVMR
jgi:hypothetical protein